MSASKRMVENRGLFDPERRYSIMDALELLAKIKKPRFDEAVEVAVRLGIDTRQSDQQVRGNTLLPHGNGRPVAIAVFAAGEAAEQAEAAGADAVGMENLVERFRKEKISFNVVIATPQAMPLVGQLGRLLGPRGLMPNPKNGTVTEAVGEAIKKARQGQMKFRADKNGTVHGSIGRISFNPSALNENLLALLTDLKKAKPAGSKGAYIKNLSLSTTMGPGVSIDMGGLKY